MVKTYEITAKWDPEAKVWVATSDDVPGLVAEAETYEALLKKLEVMVPELLGANGVLQPNEQFDIPIHLHTERFERLRGHE